MAKPNCDISKCGSASLPVVLKCKDCKEPHSLSSLIQDVGNEKICGHCYIKAKFQYCTATESPVIELYKEKMKIEEAGVDFNEVVLDTLNELKNKNEKQYFTYLNQYILLQEKQYCGRVTYDDNNVTRCNSCNKITRQENSGTHVQTNCHNCVGKSYTQKQRVSLAVKEKNDHSKLPEPGSKNFGIFKDKHGNKKFSKLLPGFIPTGTKDKPMADSEQQTFSNFQKTRPAHEEKDRNLYEVERKDYIWHSMNNEMFVIGDIVSIFDSDNFEEYFAQILQLYQDKMCNYKANIRWLIPTANFDRSSRFIDSSTFTFGPVESELRRLDTMNLICRCPSPEFMIHSKSSDRKNWPFLRNGVNNDVTNTRFSWSSYWGHPTPLEMKYNSKVLWGEYMAEADRLQLPLKVSEKSTSQRTTKEKKLPSKEQAKNKLLKSATGSIKPASVSHLAKEKFQGSHLLKEKSGKRGRPTLLSSRGRPTKLKQATGSLKIIKRPILEKKYRSKS